jgi:hypothetical protein
LANAVDKGRNTGNSAGHCVHHAFLSIALDRWSNTTRTV